VLQQPKDRLTQQTRSHALCYTVSFGKPCPVVQSLT
jgi:hypothetical protein